MIILAVVFPGLWVLLTVLIKKNTVLPVVQYADSGLFSKLLQLPAFLCIAGKGPVKTSYTKKLKIQILEFYGQSEAEDRFLWHQSVKFAFVGIAMEFCFLIGLGSKMDFGYGAFGIMMIAAAFFLPDSRLNQAIKKRKIEMMLDFPEFLVKLTLLINAGMTVTKAWEKVTEGSDKSRALGRELEMAAIEIKSGKSEFRAYEDFAKRCRMQEVTRVVSVLLQNIKKGNAELVSILRIHANECWEMRKNAAKKLGEEASSKMLLPMAIMLVSILLIVTTPAILALQGL